MSEALAVVFGTLLHDVAEDWPGRNQLLLAMRHDRRVVLLQQTRSHGLGCLRRPAPWLIEQNDGVVRIGNAFALSTRPRLRRIARLLGLIDGLMLRRLLADVGVPAYLIWLAGPNAVLIAGRGRNKYVYDCADPSFAADVDPDFDRAERAVVQDAALVFATAHTLLRRMSSWNGCTFLLPNATSRVDDKPASPASEGPVAGYVGTIDARFDAAAVCRAAQELPTWRIELVGRVNDPDDPQIRRLRSFPNVVMTGQVLGDAARAHLRRFSVALIPFTPRPMNDAIDPVKMYDYLAYGIPVVSLDLAEPRSNPFVHIAADPARLAEAIEAAHREDSEALRRERRRWAAVNTWKIRAQEAQAILDEHGLLS